MLMTGNLMSLLAFLLFLFFFFGNLICFLAFLLLLFFFFFFLLDVLSKAESEESVLLELLKPDELLSLESDRSEESSFLLHESLIGRLRQARDLKYE